MKIIVNEEGQCSCSSNKLKPCPFCGVRPILLISDDEGNIHFEEGYMNSPWSGLGFIIGHHTSQKGAEDCPIALYESDVMGGWSGIGARIYDSEDEAAKYWNRRK